MVLCFPGQSLVESYKRAAIRRAGGADQNHGCDRFNLWPNDQPGSVGQPVTDGIRVFGKIAADHTEIELTQNRSVGFAIEQEGE